jgi:tRNA A-37 threonylcarbamoyl transferase component Bud32
MTRDERRAITASEDGLVADELPPQSYVRDGSLRAWLQQDIRLSTLSPPDGDPDRLLRGPAAHVIKDQRKVMVGIASVVPGFAASRRPSSIYIKRYNVFSARVRWASLWKTSPAFRAWHAARALARAGFRTPEPVAAVEYRRRGMLTKSFFLTTGVEGAVPADQYWWDLRQAPAPERRRFVAELAGLFAALHAAGVYHNDLKDANVLVRHGPAGHECYLLDLECVRRGPRVSRRRRVKNLVQLHRTLGRLANMRENLYFLRCYLGEDARETQVRRRWRRAVCARARRKDLRHALRGLSEWAGW